MKAKIQKNANMTNGNLDTYTGRFMQTRIKMGKTPKRTNVINDTQAWCNFNNDTQAWCNFRLRKAKLLICETIAFKSLPVNRHFLRGG